MVWICYVRVEKQPLHDKRACNSWEVNGRRFGFIPLPQLSSAMLFFQYYKHNLTNPLYQLHLRAVLLKPTSNLQLFPSFCKARLQYRVCENKHPTFVSQNLPWQMQTEHHMLFAK